jgi:hypothetical protein
MHLNHRDQPGNVVWENANPQFLYSLESRDWIIFKQSEESSYQVHLNLQFLTNRKLLMTQLKIPVILDALSLYLCPWQKSISEFLIIQPL